MMTTSNEHNNAPAVPQGVPEINYPALIEAAFAKNRRWTQGTTGCIAFARGAEWFRELMLAATPAPALAVPAEIDVRTILLDIVPGDGNGQEVYARTVDDVANKLTEMAERLDAAEATAPAQEAMQSFTVPDDLPGMWEHSDLTGGETDCTKTAQEVATLSLAAEDVHAAFTKNFPKSRISQAWINFAADIAQAIAARAAKSAQEVGLTGCNCRWDGSEQVQWCELHLAHKEAIHEWADRAKTAEAKLDRLSSNQEVGLTDEEPAHVAGLLEHRRELDAIEFFESTNRDSYEFKKSVRGIYVNPAVARDWKWFQLGMKHATEDES